MGQTSQSEFRKNDMKITDASAVTHRPTVTAVEIRTPEDANAGTDLIDVQVTQLQASPQQIQRVVVSLKGGTVAFHSSNLRLRTRSSVRNDLLAFVVFGRQASGTVAGFPVRPGLMLVVPPDTAVDFVVGEGWQSVALLIPPEAIGAYGEAGFRRPQAAEILEADPEHIFGLFEWGKCLAEAAVQQPEVFNKPSAQLSAAEAELPERLAAVLAVASAYRPNRTDLKRRAQHRIVRIAEDVAMSRVGSGFYVKDMCDAAGVSERTLEYAFRDVMGLSPVAFLIRLRLHRARQALLAADLETSTVTAIALHWGFGHLGEFARDYKACFGELPSETLVQRRAEIPNPEVEVIP